MDIRETLLELINSETIRYSYMAIEKLIIVMMKDYLGSQNKRLLQRMRLYMEFPI